MVVAFVAALPGTNRLCLSCFVDSALGLPEKICGVHRHCYTSLGELECELGMALELLNIIIKRT